MLDPIDSYHLVLFFLTIIFALAFLSMLAERNAARRERDEEAQARRALFNECCDLRHDVRMLRGLVHHARGIARTLRTPLAKGEQQ